MTTQRTLKEWANFLNRYVFINPDGSAIATESKPILKGYYKVGNNLNNILNIFWDYKSQGSSIIIPEEAVDHSPFKYVSIGELDHYTPYYLGWENSITEPDKDPLKDYTL